MSTTYLLYLVYLCVAMKACGDATSTRKVQFLSSGTPMPLTGHGQPILRFDWGAMRAKWAAHWPCIHCL